MGCRVHDFVCFLSTGFSSNTLVRCSREDWDYLPWRRSRARYFEACAVDWFGISVNSFPCGVRCCVKNSRRRSITSVATHPSTLVFNGTLTVASANTCDLYFVFHLCFLRLFFLVHDWNSRLVFRWGERKNFLSLFESSTTLSAHEAWMNMCRSSAPISRRLLRRFRRCFCNRSTLPTRCRRRSAPWNHCRAHVSF